ncbi:MAG TPA: hypothetical protein DCE41_14145 [Cytophagales bacterium]|nr:hypothetical protein [Cytophagales bacterium]
MSWLSQDTRVETSFKAMDFVVMTKEYKLWRTMPVNTKGVVMLTLGPIFVFAFFLTAAQHITFF